MSHGKVARTSNVDLISNMPENVTTKILECLPLEDAVRTSILSTDWRYKWASVSHIILDKRFFSTIIVDRKKDSSSADLSDAYVNIVNNVLLCHAGYVRKLVLYLPYYVTKAVNIDQWIRSVSGKGGLKEFNLIYHRNSVKKLPSIVFSFAKLTNLKLTQCEIHTLPQWFLGFPCLVKLGLIDCEFKSSAELETFICKCPQLRHLELFITQAFNLTIHAPKLDYFFASGLYYTFCLGYETTKIKSLHLDILGPFCMNTLRSLFVCLPEIEFLSLGSCFWAVSKSWGNGLLKEEELVEVFSRLRTLDLIGISLHCFHTIDLALGVLSYSYRLQRLYCRVSKCIFCKFGTSSKITSFKKGNLSKLKYAEFVGVSGSALEVEIMKVILECAPELEVMSIELGEEVKEAEEKLRISIELMRFPRASRHAEVIFNAP